MEDSISFSYKGAISDAITEAQRQKMLFVVYISGEDENSTLLAQSTWVDLNVSDLVSKYCIFLHLRQGSIEASQFSAIYPQNSIPSITVVGLNGVVIWKHEGYVSAENFIENMEKAWAALHLQETAATFLKVALSSRNAERPSSSSSVVASVEQGSSSSLDASASADEHSHGLVASQSTNSKQVADNRIDGEPGKKICSRSDDVNTDKNFMVESSSLASERSREAMHSVAGDKDYDTVCRDEIGTSAPKETSKEVLNSVTGDVDSHTTCSEQDGSTSQQKNLTLGQQNTAVSLDVADILTSSQEITDAPAANMEEGSQAQKSDGLFDCSNATKSNDVYLNIRLPNGASLQTKFVVTDMLRSVRSYVDENEISGVTSYDLAVPYPRKIFSEQDMRKTLHELGFASRQALIVVPHRQATQPHRSESSNDSLNNVDGTNPGDSGGGYFGFVKRALSYLNPFSYFGGNSSSASSQSVPNDSLWQYRPNPALQNYLSGTDAPHLRQNPSSDIASNTRRGTSGPFGSNIHTLRHDEDEGPSADRNTYWNGNSTQYGGNDK